MVSAGELDEYVDSSGVKLENVTDALEFKQLHNIKHDVQVPTTIRQKTDDTLELLYDLRRFAIEGDVWLTEPEVVTWVALTVASNSRLPEKSWKITYTDEKTNATTLTGTMVLTQLVTIDPGVGSTNHHIRLESVDGAVVAA